MGVAQLVEHLVVVQDVAGSSPVTHPKGLGHGVEATNLRSPRRAFLREITGRLHG